jgi:hypothetical protein
VSTITLSGDLRTSVMVQLCFASRAISRKVICNAAGTVVSLEVYVFVVRRVLYVEMIGIVKNYPVAGVMCKVQFLRRQQLHPL